MSLLTAVPAVAQQPRPGRPPSGLLGGGVGDAEQSLTLGAQWAQLVDTCRRCHKQATAEFAASYAHAPRAASAGDRGAATVRHIYGWVIGLVIGAQAFQASPAKHAPAVVLALIPNIAEWAKTQIDGALAAAGTSVATVGLDKLAGTGVLYHGLESLGGGSVLAGMVLGAMAVFIIENQMRRAAAWSFAGAILAWVGLIHGAQLGWAQSPMIALGYALFGVTCLVLGRGAAEAPARA